MCTVCQPSVECIKLMFRSCGDDGCRWLCTCSRYIQPVHAAVLCCWHWPHVSIGQRSEPGESYCFCL